MKKRILSMLMAVCMIVGLLPTTVLHTHVHAEGETVATVGTDSYTTLQAAIDAADGKTVVLLQDVALSGKLIVETGKTVTLDLAGFEISYTEAIAEASNLIVNRGTLIINDSSEAKTGAITYTATNPDGSATPSYASNVINNVGVLTINGGTLTNATNPAGPACYVVDNFCGGSLTVNGGSLKTGSYAIRQGTYGDISKANNVTINGGSLSGYRAIWVQLSGDDNAVAPEVNLTITGGTLTSTDTDFNSAIYVRTYGMSYANTKITISGGTFNGAIALTGPSSNPPAVTETVSITGGTFNCSADCAPIYSYNTNMGGFVTGGTFRKAIDSKLLADGYAALPDLSGNYVVGTKPTATVNNLGEMTVPAGDYYIYDGSLTTGTEDMPLNFVMQFVADQTAEDMQTSPFAGWYADFVITFENIENGAFNPAGCYLAGYYGETDSWDGLWVKIPVDGVLASIEEDVRYPVMLGVGMPQIYEYICSGVQAFSCAMYIPEEILKANPNLKVKLELDLVDSSLESSVENAALNALISGENIYKVSEEIYDAEDFKTHTHSYTSVVTAPTCTEQGFTTYTCSCNDSYVDDYVPALGHSFTNYTVVEGVETAQCDRNCGETDTLTVSISIDENGRVTVTGDSASVDRVYIYYIGTETYTGKTGEIDWYSAPEGDLLKLSMNEANKAYNGPSGYYTIDKGNDGLCEYALNPEATGNYVFRVRIAGKSYMITRNVKEIAPIEEKEPVFDRFTVEVDDYGNISLKGDANDVYRTYIYYIGSETYTGRTGEVGWWSEADETALTAISMLDANKAYNGVRGFYTHDAEAAHRLVKTGRYVIRVRLTDTNSVVFTMDITDEFKTSEESAFEKFAVNVDADGKVTLTGDTTGVNRVYIYAIGGDVYEGKLGEIDWYSAPEKALLDLTKSDANKANNGPAGYDTIDDVVNDEYVLKADGNYVFRVRYVEDGVTKNAMFTVSFGDVQA